MADNSVVACLYRFVTAFIAVTLSFLKPLKDVNELQKFIMSNYFFSTIVKK